MVWMARMQEEGLRGCLLCDAMGLGKTWEIVGRFLYVSVIPPNCDVY